MTAADGPANGNVPDADLADLADDAVNRRYWDGYSGEYQQTHGPQLRQPMVWGLYGTPERRVRALGEVRDRDILELGCGAAQWSIFLAQQGARPVGLDNSEQQLAHARRLMDELGVDFPLVHSPAEKTPLPSASFDLVFCDHGAMSYVDPALSLPEVGRLLRPGGRLVFNLTTPFTYVCWNDDLERADESLHYDYFGMRRWVDIEGFVSYEVGYGEWIRLFRRHGFVVEDLIELRPARSARSSYRTRADLDWSRRWPGEHIWCVYREG